MELQAVKQIKYTSKYNLELYMTATELTESTERGVWGGKSISVLSVADKYKQ